MAPITTPSTSNVPLKKRRRGGQSKSSKLNPKESILGIPKPPAPSQIHDEDDGDDEDDIMVDSSNITIPATTIISHTDIMEEDAPNAASTLADAPLFAPLPASAQKVTAATESRKISIPPHRMTPLKKDWINIFSPLTEMLGLQVRMNVQRRAVEIRVCSISPIQRRRRFKLLILPIRRRNIPKKLVQYKKEQTS